MERGCSSRLQRLARSARRAGVACNRGLRRLLGGESENPWVRAGAAYYCLMNTWLLCKLSAGL